MPLLESWGPWARAGAGVRVKTFPGRPVCSHRATSFIHKHLPTIVSSVSLINVCGAYSTVWLCHPPSGLQTVAGHACVAATDRGHWPRAVTTTPSLLLRAGPVSPTAGRAGHTGERRQLCSEGLRRSHSFRLLIIPPGSHLGPLQQSEDVPTPSWIIRSPAKSTFLASQR